MLESNISDETKAQVLELKVIFMKNSKNVIEIRIFKDHAW